MNDRFLKYSLIILINLLNLNLCMASSEHYRVECDLGLIESSLAVRHSLVFKWPTQREGEMKKCDVSCTCIKSVKWMRGAELNLKESGKFETEITVHTAMFKDGEKVKREIIFSVDDGVIYYVHVAVKFTVRDTYSVPSVVVLSESDLGSDYQVKTRLLGGLEIMGKNPDIKIVHYDSVSGLLNIVVDSSIASHLPWVGTLHIRGLRSEHIINFLATNEKKKNNEDE